MSGCGDEKSACRERTEFSNGEHSGERGRRFVVRRPGTDRRIDADVSDYNYDMLTAEYYELKLIHYFDSDTAN